MPIATAQLQRFGDVLGRDMRAGVTYEPFGAAKNWTWGNSTTSSRTFDTDGKVTQIVSAATKNYGYDDAFRITGITDAGTPANSYTYGYDLLDRLTSAVKTGTTRGWTYDANGNRLTETGASPSTSATRAPTRSFISRAFDTSAYLQTPYTSCAT